MLCSTFIAKVPSYYHCSGDVSLLWFWRQKSSNVTFFSRGHALLSSLFVMDTETNKSEKEGTVDMKEAMLVHPMMTEEPIDFPALERETARLSEVNEDDHVPQGIVESATEPNKIPVSTDAHVVSKTDAEAESPGQGRQTAEDDNRSRQIHPDNDPCRSISVNRTTQFYSA